MRKEFKKFKISQQAIVIRDGKILTLRDSDGDWLLPGGRIDHDEIFWEDALRRELKEELNVSNVEILQTIGSDFGKLFDVIAVAYLCVINDLENLRLSDEHLEVKWVDIDELENHLYYKKIGKDLKMNLKLISI